MPIAIVDTHFATNYSTVHTFTPDTAPTAGNTGILVSDHGFSGVLSPVTDNSSGTPAYNLDHSVDSDGIRWHRRAITGSPTALTITGSTEDFRYFWWIEASGVDTTSPEDENSTYAELNGGTPGTSHTINFTAAEAGQLIVAYVRANTTTWTGTGGAVALNSGSTDRNVIYTIASSAGAGTLTFTTSDSQVPSAAYVSYQEAAAGGPAIPVLSAGLRQRINN